MVVSPYRIRSNFRMAKFTKITGLQAFRKNIFENQRKLTMPRLRRYGANDR